MSNLTAQLIHVARAQTQAQAHASGLVGNLPQVVGSLIERLQRRAPSATYCNTFRLSWFTLIMLMMLPDDDDDEDQPNWAEAL